MEGYPGSCWDRARFLAIRAELSDSWRPRNSLEQMLLDQAASYQFLLFQHLETLAHYSAMIDRGARRDLRDNDPHSAPKLSAFEAHERAADMVGRLQRMFQGVLKALRDQRRVGPPVVVRGAGQVNIAQQQVNLNR